MKLLRLLPSVLLGILILAGCARGSTEIVPPEIRYGEDVCAHCTMIISDPRFAAGYAHEVATGRYESLAFDDIGDMLAEAELHPDRVIVAYYVHDYTSEEWLDADQAHFVVSTSVATPMGSGITAHATADAAQAMAAEVDGEVYRWEELMTGNTAHMHHDH